MFVGHCVYRRAGGLIPGLVFFLFFFFPFFFPFFFLTNLLEPNSGDTVSDKTHSDSVWGWWPSALKLHSFFVAVYCSKTSTGNTQLVVSQLDATNQLVMVAAFACGQTTSSSSQGLHRETISNIDIISSNLTSMVAPEYSGLRICLTSERFLFWEGGLVSGRAPSIKVPLWQCLMNKGAGRCYLIPQCKTNRYLKSSQLLSHLTLTGDIWIHFLSMIV